MWRERTVQRLVAMTKRADLLVYSIGVAVARVPSYVYVGGYLEPADLKSFDKEQVVGDIATVFFRTDGIFEGISPQRARQRAGFIARGARRSTDSASCQGWVRSTVCARRSRAS